jgi:hypothetical protein
MEAILRHSGESILCTGQRDRARDKIGMLTAVLLGMIPPAILLDVATDSRLQAGCVTETILGAEVSANGKSATDGTTHTSSPIAESASIWVEWSASGVQIDREWVGRGM